jgi:hypothetical protein
MPTYGVGLIDVAAGGEEEVGDALGSAEGRPVQRDVHLHVRHERVGTLLQQVADHNLVPVREDVQLLDWKRGFFRFFIINNDRMLNVEWKGTGTYTG